MYLREALKMVAGAKLREVRPYWVSEVAVEPVCAFESFPLERGSLRPPPEFDRMGFYARID